MTVWWRALCSCSCSPLVGNHTPRLCFSISTSSVSWCPYSCCLSAVTVSLTALTAWLQRDCTFAYAELSTVTLTSHKGERRDMTVNSEVSFPMLCFETHVCDTTGKTHHKILAEFLCLVFSFSNGLFSFQAEWCRSVSVCLPGPPGLRAGSNLVYSGLKVSWQVVILSVSLWQGCAPPAVQGDRSLILSAIWLSQSNKLHFPQPLCVSTRLTVLANYLSNTGGGK